MHSPQDDKIAPFLAPDTGLSGGAPAEPKAGSDKGSGFGALRVSLMPSDDAEHEPDLRKRLLILAIVLIVETLLIGGVYVVLDQRARAQQAELHDLRQQRTQLTASIAAQEAAADELSAFAMQVNAITPRLDAHVYWTNILTLVEQYTRPSVRYENVVGGIAGNILTLSASAPSYREMAEQILAFRAAPMVRSVRADAAAAQAGSGSVKWNMVLEIAPEAWLLTSKEAVQNPAAVSMPEVDAVPIQP